MARRRWVRESDNPSVLDKRFRPVRTAKARIDRSRLAELPDVVVRDLRRGNLKSLDRYLEVHRGIPDEPVAVALRLLLSGGPEHTKHQLIAIEHPMGPAPKPGPKAITFRVAPSAEEVELVRLFKEALEVERGKKLLAEKNAARASGMSVSKVQRARRAVRDYEQAQAANWTITPEQIEQCMAELRVLAARR